VARKRGGVVKLATRIRDAVVRACWKALLCEPEERAELNCTLHAGSPEWVDRYKRYVFVYQKHLEP
jgi:hypothetical protein